MAVPFETIMVEQRRRSYDEIEATEVGQPIPPYSVDTEPMPLAAIYTKEGQQAMQLAQDIFSPFLETIVECKYRDEVINALQMKLEAAKTIKGAKNIQIGLLGDAGTGKSSLINGLLAEEDIARTGSGGKSCTQVVQKFGPRTPDQQSVFQASIYLLNSFACKELVKQQARNYIQYCIRYETLTRDGSTADQEYEEEKEEEGENQTANFYDFSSEKDRERMEAKNESETALEILTALFPNISDFADKDEAASFLGTAKGTDDRSFLNRLEILVDKLYGALQQHNGPIVIGADDIDKFHEALEPYTKNQQRSNILDLPAVDEPVQPNLWPLVLSIDITFNNLLTNEGVVLVDMPGITDINQQRVKAAHRTLQQCSHYVIVGKIGRFTSDLNVKRYLTMAADRRPNNLVLVATSSDDIEIKADFDCPLTAAQREEYATLQKKIQEICIELDAKPTSGRSRFRQNQLAINYDNPERQKLRLLRDKLQNRLIEILIQARNSFVKAECQDSFKRLLDYRKHLTIFCVSSKEHHEHICGYEQFETPKMSVENTELPAFRTFLRSLPAKIKYRIFSGHCRSKIPSLLNSIEMSCSLNGAERKEAWSNFIMQAGKSLESQIEDITKKSLTDSLQSTINQMALDEAKWVDEARKLCERIWFLPKRIKAGAFRAAMKNCGEHSIRDIGDNSMSGRLLQIVNQSCKKPFEEQRKKQIEWSVETAQAINMKLLQLEDKFKDDPAGNAAVLARFYENMQNISEELQKVAEKTGDNVKKGINQCLNKATKKGPEGYLIIALQPVYQHCFHYNGRGATAARKKHFGDALYGKDNVFALITKKFKSDAESVIKCEVDKFNCRIQRAMTEIHGNLNEVCHKIINDSEEGKQLCRDLLALVEPAREMLETQIKPLLRRCDDIEAGRVVKKEDQDAGDSLFV